MEITFFAILGFLALALAQTPVSVPSPQYDLCNIFDSSTLTDNAYWPANLATPTNSTLRKTIPLVRHGSVLTIPVASTADFVCSSASCVGNTGIPNRIDDWTGQYVAADSIMVLLQPGSTLLIENSNIWKQGATAVAPWVNNYGYNAAVTVVSLKCA